MATKKLSAILTACYLAVVASTFAYELSVRIYDRGNSEFAGLLSVVLTLPASFVLIVAGKTIFGVNVGDSDTSFVVILGLSVLMNASIVWMVVRVFSRPKQE